MVKRFNLYKEKALVISSDLQARWIAPNELKYIETKENTFWKFVGEMIDGSRCLGLIKDKEVVSYLWINSKYLICHGIKEQLKENECCLYNTATKPDRRGNGYAEILRAKCYEILKAQGKDTFYSFSGLNNKPALRFKEKIGAEIIASYMYFEFWKFKYLKKYDTVQKG